MTPTGNQPLAVMDFGVVISDKKLKSVGLTRGTEVLVTAFKPVQDDPKDPYVVRNYVLVAKVEDNYVQIPGDGNDYNVFLLDPRSLDPVSEERKERLHEIIRQQFA